MQWIAKLRIEGIDSPVRIGVPGPTQSGKLLRFAHQFGVDTSDEVLQRYGVSPENPKQEAGPERFLTALQSHGINEDYGTVRYHLYPFGGMSKAISNLENCMNGMRRSAVEGYLTP